MNVIIYHEVNKKTVKNVLRNGLKYGSEGAKTDAKIKKADQFLDAHLPPDASRQLNRQKATYGYIAQGDSLIDIKNGQPVPLKGFLDQSSQALLRITVDPSRCYVSDLDKYDAVKRALELSQTDSRLKLLAEKYWQGVVALDSFVPGSVLRPEVMICYDVPPECITGVA
jgi:hypothetical protein